MAAMLQHARVNASSAAAAHPFVRAALLWLAPLSAAAAIVGSGYLVAAAVGIVLWTDRSAPTWPVAIEAVLAAALGVHGVVSRYRDARGTERRRMHWVALAVAVASEVVLVALTLRVL